MTEREETLVKELADWILTAINDVQWWYNWRHRG